MPVTPDKPAPYAPTSAVIGLIERHRNKGLPSPVDGEVLGRAGISPSLTPRTLYALQTLDLIDDEGRPTKIFEGLRLAPEAEYKQRLAEWLHSAYADALQFVDPSKDDEIKVRDAFRTYKPIGQQDRMVTLFIGLFVAAGIATEKGRQPPRNTQPKMRAIPSAPRPTRAERAPKGPTDPSPFRGEALSSSLPPAIAGLLASLPAVGDSWTKAERDRFVTTFGAVLDFCFPVAAGQKLKPREDTDE